LARTSSQCSVSLAALALLGALLLSTGSVAARNLETEPGEDPRPGDTTNQVITAPDAVDSAEVLVPLDTVIYEPGDVLSEAAPVTDSTNFEKHLYQNPTIGLFKSMLVPGWGQAANRSYIKALLCLGLDAWFIGSAIHYKTQAADWLEKYDNATTISARNDFYGLYEDRRDRRNKFTWFAVIVTFLSMFDAYVDAHLSGFPAHHIDHDRDIEIRIVPRQDGELEASLSLSF
jgi:hypothetical protein